MELMLYRSGSEAAARYTLANGETIIGRRPDCLIVLDAPSISPRHVRLFTLDGHAVIYAIDDAWPVYVNGEPVRRQVLCDGDEIELGHYRIRCVDASGGGHADSHPGPEPTATADGPVNEVDAAGAASEPSPGRTFHVVAPPVDHARMADIAATVDDVPVDDGVPINDEAEPAMEGAGPTGPDPEPAVARPASTLQRPDPTVDAQDIGDIPTDQESLDAARDDVDDVPPPRVEPTTPAAPKDEARRDPEAEPDAASGKATSTRPRDYHLDILTGINRGRRVALTRDRVVLGFNQQRLVEIRNQDGTLSLRSIDAEAAAHLNDEPITDEPVEAGPGDVISLRRIDLRIHQGY